MSSPLDRDDFNKTKDIVFFLHYIRYPRLVAVDIKCVMTYNIYVCCWNQSRFTSIVQSFVDGVLNHLTIKVDVLEKEN